MARRGRGRRFTVLQEEGRCNCTMSVRKRPDGGWIADVTVGRKLDGSPDRRTSTHRTKKAAQEAERKLLLLRDLKRGRSYGSVPFRDFVEGYFWPQKTNLRPTTVKGYKRDIRLRLLPAFGDMTLEDIGRLEIQRMLLSCPSKKVATNARETLSSIMGLAVEMGALQVNPAGFRYSYPASSDRTGEEFGVWLSSFAEITEVLQWMASHYPDTPEERMVLLGLAFGLRKSEVLGLDSERVDVANRRIEIVQGYTQGEGGPQLGPPKTPKALRFVPMVQFAAERISQWDMAPGPVVADAKGRRLGPSTARGRIAAVFSVGNTFDDGRPLPHLTQFSMRHSFGTACIDAGIEVAKVSKWMGHVDVSTTYNRYVKPRQKDVAKEAALIDAAMGF